MWLLTNAHELLSIPVLSLKATRYGLTSAIPARMPRAKFIVLFSVFFLTQKTAAFVLGFSSKQFSCLSESVMFGYS